MLRPAASTATTAAGQDTTTLLTKPETESLVATLFPNSLPTATLAQHGSPTWLTTHHLPLHHLALQSALNVRSGTEEYVSDSLLPTLPLLIHDLVLTRTWKAQVYPLVRAHLAAHASIVGYALLSHECVMLNLLQACMYKREAVDAAGDAITDLVDVATAWMSYLNSDPPTPESSAMTSAGGVNQVLAQASETQLVNDQKLKLDFECAWHALACLAHMSHHVDELPLAVLARMVNTKDVIYLLAHLLDARVWERKPKGKGAAASVEVYMDGQWVERKGDDVLLVTKCEGLAWMAVANLVLHGEVQRRYEMTEVRRKALLRLVAQFDCNSTLLTQLPFLEPVLRYLLTLQLSTHDPDRPAAHAITASLGVLVESLPQFPPSTLVPASVDLSALAQSQQQWWTPELNRTFAMHLAHAYEGNVLEALLEVQPKCSVCGVDADQRCSQCRSEWYCSRKCQVKAWKRYHKDVCALLAGGDARKARTAQENKDKRNVAGQAAVEKETRFVELLDE
ncbi:hypothetical protein BCR44DRAFT_121088 [Catenaria anguillulae PL171]|uniref:MYND-type domain-containing protein n=1 Tax=Catenaria anguillulae PL171 TaxID=765915 RepID=A0A1Y2I106_9FUNG|nr:hypothetical protein BCR44DRAFT_121088 [Catenaria anguillulae PL171]